jgi:hypothetical protein
MKQTILAIATGRASADAARLRADHGICAYPWHIGGERPGNPVSGMNVDLTESKFHSRWPGAPSP